MQNNMKEEWKDIKGYEGLYKVSNTGKIKSIGRWIDRKCKGKRWEEEKIMKLSLNKRGYQIVGLSKNGVKLYQVHRLVAQAFIQNPNNYPQVNHKDENKQNNCIQNLEWCDTKYNNNYGTRLERIFKKTTNGKCSKVVLQIDTATENVIAEFPSINEVKRQLGLTHISECCKGKRNTAGGFKWKYKSTT